MTTMKRAVIMCALLVAACAPEPIEWEAAHDIPGTIGANTRLLMNGHAAPRLVDDSTRPMALPPGACDTSVTTARAHAGEWYAAWFMARPDSSAVLMVARSTDDGETWRASVVDARDRGRRGCSRPRPALVADAASGYVHIAYFLQPSAGAGVWYTHSMERGTVWHQTIGVLYGEVPASTSIASAGDTVLVAYEHPGSGSSRLGVAISRQAGHTFAERVRAVRVNGSARDPRIAFRAGRIALAWTERPASADGSGVARTRMRLGSVR